MINKLWAILFFTLISVDIYSQNCVVTPIVNSVTFVSSSAGNCTYDVNVQVTVGLNPTSWVFFNFDGNTITQANIGTGNSVCYVGVSPGVFNLDGTCAVTPGRNAGRGDPVVSHTGQITIPCGTTPSITYAGSQNADPTGGNVCGEGTFDFTGVNPTGPLPVKLTSFTSKTDVNGNLLKWSTAEEVNSKKFVVQRSQNAVMFNDIHSVETGSNSNEPKRYSYLDDSPVFGANYYRLKQIDIDGSINFSQIIVAMWESQSEVLYPNPVVDKKFLVKGVTGNIIRTTLLGNIGLAIPFQLVKNEENATITLPESINSGIYFLQIQTSTKSISKKIVVQ